MTERTKRPKSKVTWSDVKSKLADFDRAGLQQLVANLYVFHKDNQTFLHARFGLGENPLEAYKQRIQAALAPDISRKRNANISVAAAKKAISEYNKAVGDPLGILELRLFWCETAVKFSMDYGYGDVGYLDALVLQYSEACIVLSALDEPFLLAGCEFSLSTSIGVSVFPEDGLDGEILLDRADMAMYRAKEAGRNGVEFFTPGMDSVGGERLSLEYALRGALDRDELVLHYQPLMSADGRLVGAEALVRWRHPEMGLVPPGDFIGLAEETGLINPLGEFVLRQACQQTQQLLEQGRQLLAQASAGDHVRPVGNLLAVDQSLLWPALSRGQTVVSNDTEAEGWDMVSMPHRHGVRSVMAVPLRSGDAIVGSLKVTSDKVNAFSRRDVAHLEILTESLGAMVQLRHVAGQLHASEQQYRMLFDEHPHPMWVYDRETLKLQAVNRSMEQHYGYTEAELLDRKSVV